MPLHKLTKIRNYGIFKKFDWNESLPTFSTHNLIYGWNYSGKTTLSRILRSFETGKKHPDYLSATYEIELKDGAKITDATLDRGAHIRVFNSDFVTENLKWNASIEPIILLGQENIELQQKLEEEKSNLGLKTEERDKLFGTKADAEARLDKALTDKARDTKNLLSIPDYTKRNFQPVVDKVQATAAAYILQEDELQKHITTYKSTDKKDKVDSIHSTLPNITELADRVRTVLGTSVNSTVIDKLKNDAVLNDWVKRGVDIHKGKTACEFCGGSLPADLFEKLGNHFSDGYTTLMSEVSTLSTVVSSRILSVAVPDDAKLFPEFKSQYSTLTEQLHSGITTINSTLQQFGELLDTKKTNAFDTLSLPEYHDNTESINKVIQDINSILEGHNAKSDSFEKEQKISLGKIINHFAAQFVIDEKYIEVKNAAAVIDKAITTANDEIGALKAAIKGIELQLSETVKGAEKVNEYLCQYFGKGDLTIKVTADNRFQLYRGDVLAKNLSEGEKTAIAFAYFIAKLEDKHTTLANSVVFIDDPISSLDSNHLFNTYSFIKIKLHGCKQLFISTHNFEFFNLIKEWFKPTKKMKPAFFLVERTTNSTSDESCIRNVPNLITDYKSEYVYLFFLIHQFHTSPTLEYFKLYTLPNIIRRYIESYTGFKFPASAGLEKKISKLISDKIKAERVLKFVHHYSHSSSITKALEFPDLCECSDVVKTVIEAVVANDKDHFDHLVGIVAPPPGD